MRRLLAERNFPVDELRYFASARSAGTTLPWRDGEITVEDAALADPSGLDIALFSAGATSSRELAPRFAAAGVTVIDNSSAFRMDPDVPLVVSEVNPEAVARRPQGHHRQPQLHDDGGDAGAQAAARRGRAGPPRRLDVPGRVRRRARPASTSSTSRPARSSTGPPSSPTTGPPSPSRRRRSSPSRSRSTCSRWPARSSTTAPSRRTRSRSCATRPARSSASRTCRSRARACGCRCSPATRCRSTPPSSGRSPSRGPSRSSPPHPASSSRDVPTPLEAAGQDPCYVGRIRVDPTVEGGRGLALFVSNDNLRKGAALNAVQIAELLLRS